MRVLRALVLIPVLLGATELNEHLPAQQTETLRWKIVAGTKRAYRLHRLLEACAQIERQLLEVTEDRFLDYTWKIGEPGGNSAAQLTLTVTRLRLSSRGGLADYDYDSRTGKEPADTLAAYMIRKETPVVGDGFRAQMDARGTVRKATLPDAMAKGDADSWRPEGMFEEIFNGGLVFPEGPLAVGQTWSDRTEHRLPAATVTIRRVHRFEDIIEHQRRRLARIRVEHEGRCKGTGEGIGNSENVWRGEGTAFFDVDAGCLVSLRVRLHDVTRRAATPDARQERRDTLVLNLMENDQPVPVPAEPKAAAAPSAAEGPKASLAGVVRSHTGAVIPGARLELRTVPGRKPKRGFLSSRSWNAVTDATGAYRFADLPADAALTLVVRYPVAPAGTFPTKIRLDAGKAHHRDLKAPAWGTVRGRVRDQAGHAVAGARVGLDLHITDDNLMDAASHAFRDFHASARTGDDGAFEIKGVPLGTWKVMIRVEPKPGAAGKAPRGRLIVEMSKHGEVVDRPEIVLGD